MKGSYEVTIKNNRVQFRLTIRRNITVLRGKSATGKTTLVGMVGDYQRDGADSGVELRCERPCVVLEGSGWESGLARYSRSIVFIDEGSRFTSSVEFARAAAASDNYFVIATRESLFNLPYSVAEVYGIDNDTRQKYRNVWRYYSSPRQLYGGHQPIVGTGLSSSRKVVLGRECQDLSRAVMTGAEPRRSKTEVQGRAFVPTLVIVEDSGSGFEFFRALCSKFNVPCRSARGKSNIYRVVAAHPGERVLVIAGGAAFGPELERVLDLSRVGDLLLLLPESFEWLLLRSGIVRDDELPSMLSDPSAFVESKDFFSWERFFTSLLCDKTRGTSLSYEKNRLNPAYLLPENVRRIVGGDA